MNIGSYTFEDFQEMAKKFHGYPAPGLMVGGYMVETAKSKIPSGTLFEAVVETRKCLPDAVQLLTPCSTGNNWMKVINLGKYALSLYDKYTGLGWRVYIDLEKLKDWPELNSWFLKLKEKDEQNTEKLFAEIEEAGNIYLGLDQVTLTEQFFKKREMGKLNICPICREAYPKKDGPICRGCQGEVPYLSDKKCIPELNPEPKIVSIPSDQAEGQKILHDMTRIIPNESKGAQFLAGQTISSEDLSQLKQMGRKRVYIETDNLSQEEWIHENKAALAFAEQMAGSRVAFNEPPLEGKVNFIAKEEGLLIVDKEKLVNFNLVPDVMCASRHSDLVVEKGKPFAGCRAIPLYISRDSFSRALSCLDTNPLFKVLPIPHKKIGVLITGTEVSQGLIEDKFLPVIKSKVEYFNCNIIYSETVPDDRSVIAKTIKKMLRNNVDLIITTAGLSVDPDDVTRLGLLDAGLEDFLYGAPILPGAMTLLGKINGVQVIGVPACALYFKTTSFDLILPRTLANQKISRQDLANMAEGGFCLQCKVCTFPKCPFGK